MAEVTEDKSLSKGSLNRSGSIELICGAALFVVAFAAYLITLTPTVPFWDAGEFIATAYVLGIPHPPGTPLYVLIGRLASIIPVSTIAVRLNFLSAFTSVLAVLFLYLSTLRLLKLWFKPPLKSFQTITCCLGALSAGLFAAFSRVFWDSAIEAEVYSLSSFFMMFCLWLSLRWWERLGEKNDDTLLLLIVYLLSLSVSIHLGTVLVAPSIVLLVFAVNWRSIFNSKFIGWAFLLCFVGVSVHLYLLIRSRLNPPIDEANPDNWRALWDVLRRDQYKPGSIFIRRADFSLQLGMYIRYLKEQFVLTNYLTPVSIYLPLALGIFGAVSHAMREKKGFLLIGTFFLITSLGLIIYLNFTASEVRERDYFYTFSFLIMAMWIGMGLAALADWVRISVKGGLQKPLIVSVWSISIILPILPVSPRPVSDRFFTHDRRGNFVAHDYAYNMLVPLEKNAVILTNGDNDTFPLWYIQEVEKVRKDVRVVNLSLLNTPWYIKQLKHQDPKVPIDMPDNVIDSLEPYRDAEGRAVLIKDIMVKHILEVNETRGAAKQPIYLAVTVPDQMGLAPRLTLEGLVFRVQPQPVGPYGKVDIDKTIQNLYHTFRYGGLLTEDRRYDETIYKDDNSFKLVQNYAAAHVRLAWQLREVQKIDDGIKEMEAARRINPFFEGVVGWLGIFYESAGKFDKARDHYREMLKKFANDPQIGLELRFRYALMLQSTGQANEAITELEKVCESGQFRDAVKTLGQMYWENGRQAEAVELLKRWLDVYPEDSEMRAIYAAYSGIFASEKVERRSGGKFIQLGKP
ncbi:MAG: DUF2723 domain-containing protein [Candidatus Eisenbacteria bacterium]|nr:DUF2723 domain-containing protein [Candidatus Eisenbacteria bacterium]